MKRDTAYDRTAARFDDDFAVHAALRRLQECFEIGLERIVEEAFVGQFDPLARDLGLEAVLQLGQHGFLERAMRGEQRDQAGRFENDAALQADRRVAGVQAAADAVFRERSR